MTKEYRSSQRDDVLSPQALSLSRFQKAHELREFNEQRMYVRTCLIPSAFESLPSQSKRQESRVAVSADQLPRLGLSKRRGRLPESVSPKSSLD